MTYNRKCAQQGAINMHIKQKWKLFAFGQFFRNDLSVEEALRLFDDLVAAQTEEDLLEILKPVTEASPQLWPEFATLPLEQVVDDMYALAMHAQDVEALDC